MIMHVWGVLVSNFDPKIGSSNKLFLIWNYLNRAFYLVYGGGKRRVPGIGGETWGKKTTGETQAQMGR